jgi:hypothetical protein
MTAWNKGNVGIMILCTQQWWAPDNAELNHPHLQKGEEFSNQLSN